MISLRISNMDTNTDPVFTATEIVTIIFSNAESMFEKRLQGLAFLSEVQWNIENNNSRKFSDAEYIRTPRGVYSESIREAINNVDNQYSRVAYDNGFRTKKWYTAKVKFSTDKLTEDTEQKAFDTITEIQETAKDKTKKDIMKTTLKMNNIKNLSTGTPIRLNSD